MAASAAPQSVGALDHIRAELHREFDGVLSSDVVDRCFAAELARFNDARVTAYLPILIMRNARARLRAIEARPLRIQD